MLRTLYFQRSRHLAGLANLIAERTGGTVSLASLIQFKNGDVLRMVQFGPEINAQIVGPLGQIIASKKIDETQLDDLCKWAEKELQKRLKPKPPKKK